MTRITEVRPATAPAEISVAIQAWPWCTKALASAAFGFYIANFGNYDATYGSMAGVIVFLLWLWILNNVLLLGAELDSEIERSRQLQAGMAAEEDLLLPLRDTTKSDAAEEAQVEVVEEARSLRIQGLKDQGRSTADLADQD